VWWAGGRGGLVPPYDFASPHTGGILLKVDPQIRSLTMIRGVHTMFYSSQAEASRAFLRDVLGFPFTDVGEGWLIFDMPEADMGIHPADMAQPGTHAISFYCDQIEETVAALKSKGVEFTMPVEDHGYGLVTYFKMPGEVLVQLYQPHYTKRRKSPPRPGAKSAARKTKKAAAGRKTPPKTKAASAKPAKRKRR
jgi:catechol 2,3-dioxygenase-like lactoylglutathione lyase family enzyme